MFDRRINLFSYAFDSLGHLFTPRPRRHRPFVPAKYHTVADRDRAIIRAVRWIKGHDGNHKPPQHIAEKIAVARAVTGLA